MYAAASSDEKHSSRHRPAEEVHQSADRSRAERAQRLRTELPLKSVAELRRMAQVRCAVQLLERG